MKIRLYFERVKPTLEMLSVSKIPMYFEEGVRSFHTFNTVAVMSEAAKLVAIWPKPNYMRAARVRL